MSPLFKNGYNEVICIMFLVLIFPSDVCKASGAGGRKYVCVVVFVNKQMI